MYWCNIYELKNGFKFVYDECNDGILDKFVNWCWRNKKLIENYSSVWVTDLPDREDIVYIPKI